MIFIKILFSFLFLARLSNARLNKQNDRIAVLLVNPQYMRFETGNNTVPGANSTNFIEFSIKLYEIGYPMIASQMLVKPLKNGLWNKNGQYEADTLLDPIAKMVDYIQINDFDSYSAFDIDGKLATYLNTNLYRTLIVLGEAGNGDVKHTITDALLQGFNVILISDMTHYIPNTPENEREIIREIENYAIHADFKVVTSKDFLKNPREAISFKSLPQYYDNNRQYFKKCNNLRSV